MMRRRIHHRPRGSILGGTILMALGAWFLANNIGYRLPGWGTIWPIFPTIGGLAFIASFVRGREKDAGVLIPGVAGFLSGLFFFFFTAGPLRWSDMSAWWPIFPIIGGLAFLATWAGTRPWDHSLLVPVVLGIMVGLGGMLVTVAGLRLHLLWKVWPVGLILLGLWMLIMGFGPGRRRREQGGDAP